jgi:hypothetical protein
LPANLHYDFDDVDLSDPPEHSLDVELRAICQRFASSDPAGRAKLRDSASMDDFYTLLSFSRRAAVFAMRQRNTERVIDGLTALAMIETKRIDFRDASVALSLLHHSGRAIGSGIDDFIEKAAALAEPEMTELMQRFLRRTEDQRGIRELSGYTAIETKAGPGFVRWNLEPYQPSLPLDQIGLALARLVQRDKYQAATVTLATSLPSFWLSSVDDRTLKRALATVRGAVSISASLRPQESRDSEFQHLVIFLAEMESESEADALLDLSRKKQVRANSFVLIGVGQGPLFCLVVARSFKAGKPSFESQASIERFAPGIAAVLQAHSPK